MAKKRAENPENSDDPDRYRVAANKISGMLAKEASDSWRRPFDADVFKVYRELGRHLVKYARLATGGEIPRVEVSPVALHAFFATERPDHAFQQEPLRWSFGLTEPMVTKTLARLLSAGFGELRARRIHAFLQAVGISAECASLIALERCRIFAEQNRIDLKLVWKDDGGQDVVVIIEAKFGHEVTGGQLSGYRTAVKRMHGRLPVASILLTLDDSDLASLVGKQHSIWKQVDWRVFWLRFERLRPIEHNPALQMFLTTIWHRSGCLTQEDRHGRIRDTQ